MSVCKLTTVTGQIFLWILPGWIIVDKSFGTTRKLALASVDTRIPTLLIRG